MTSWLATSAHDLRLAELAALAERQVLDVPFSLWLHLSHEVEDSGDLISVAELTYLPRALDRYVSPAALDGQHPVIGRGSGGTLRPTERADTAPDGALEFGAALLGPIMLAFSRLAAPLCALALNTRERDLDDEGSPRPVGELLELDIITSCGEGTSRVCNASISLSDLSHTRPEVIYGALFDESDWELDRPGQTARMDAIVAEHADDLTDLLEAVRSLAAELAA